MGKVKNLIGKNPNELLKSLPKRREAYVPPIPKGYYNYEWGVYAVDQILQQSLAQYISEKQEGECKQIFYKGKSLDIYSIPTEGIDFVKEKIKNLGIKKSKENFILHRLLRPKTSSWTMHSWK